MTKEGALIDQELGQLLQMIRRAAGLSQYDVARAAGISFQQIQKYELGLNRVSVCRLFALAAAMGERPATILTMLEERLAPRQAVWPTPEDTRTEFLASPRGRNAVSALAACVNDRLIDAVTKLLVASSGEPCEAVTINVPRAPLVFDGNDGPE